MMYILKLMSNNVILVSKLLSAVWYLDWWHRILNFLTASNRRPILISISDFYLQSSVHQYIRSMLCLQILSIGVQFSNLCPFSNSQIDVQLPNLWPFLAFSNRRPITLLTYALTLTNKSAIDLRIYIYTSLIYRNGNSSLYLYNYVLWTRICPLTFL